MAIYLLQMAMVVRVIIVLLNMTSNGNFIKTWGVTGAEKGEFRDPHALAMDSEGKVICR